MPFGYAAFKDPASCQRHDNALRHAREQDGVSATVYARSGETWTHEILIADSILALPEIGVELPLAELCDGIVFETEQNSDRTRDGA